MFPLFQNASVNNKTLDHLLIALTVLFDLCFVSTAIVVAYWVRFESGWLESLALHQGGTPPLDAYFRLIPVMAVIWVLFLKTFKLYRPEDNATFFAFWRLCKTTISVLIATLAALFFIYHHDAYSRWVMLLASGFSLIGLSIGRLVLHRFRQSIHAQGVGITRLAIIGTPGPRIEKLLNALRTKTDSGSQVIGLITPTAPTTQETETAALPHLGETDTVLDVVQTHRIDTLFIDAPTIPDDTSLQILHACEGVPVQINVLPNLPPFISGGTAITFLEGIPLLRLRETPMQGIHGILKRLIDIVFSLTAILLLSPLMIAIGVAIRITSPGKALFSQERVGRAGKPFSIYKFRSMRADAEAEVGHVWAENDDPRQTELGKFLRRWSLDELPQFFNVLKGDMSLVGPRPEMSGLIDVFQASIPHYLARQRVKSGMTGWAQVNGLRGNTSLEDRISYDRYYIENWSLGLDIKIIFKTLGAIRAGNR